MGEAAEKGKERWPQVRLGDVCDDKITSISSKENFDIIYIDISSIDNKTKCISSYTKIPAKKAPSRAKQILKLNDILVSTVRPNLNAVAINTLDEDTVVVGSTGYCVLRSTEKIENKYLFYFCQSPTFIEQLVKRAKGASYPAVSNVDVKNIQIPLPPLPEQRRIAAVLDQVSSLIALRKAQLAKLDLLVKARFVEMFISYYGHNEMPLNEVCKFIDYRGKTPEKSEKGIPLITAKNVKNNEFSIEPREFIPTENYDSIMTRGIPRINDVLFTTEAPLGNVCRIPAVYKKFCVGQRIITIQPNRGVLVSSYLEAALLRPEFQDKIWKKSSGSTVKGIRSKLLGELTIPIPPIEIQEQFEVFVEQTNKSKSEIQQGLIQLETLKKSLMQEYFG